MHIHTYSQSIPPLLPHKMYQMAYQEIAEVAFSNRSKIGVHSDIEKMLSILSNHLFLSMGRVLTPNHNLTKLYIRYAYGIPKEKRFTHYDIDQGITGLIYSSQQPIYADDLDTNSMYVGKLCSTNDLPHADPAITGVPIFNSKNILKGVLCVNHGYRDRNELSEIIGVLEKTAEFIGALMGTNSRS